MIIPTPLVLSWSGGKDSAIALYELLRDPDWTVTSLLTSVSDEFHRVSHHGIREELLEMQAAAIGLPLDWLRLPSGGGPCTNAVYEELVGQHLSRYVERGIRHVAHGDLFLADLRAYRERNLARLGMNGVFPIWGRNTRQLVETFIELGFKAVLCCVDGRHLDGSFAGRLIDEKLLRDLPPNVDPCGENGEYHSFVYDGPIFEQPLEIVLGQTICRDGRHYIDVLPAAAAAGREVTAAAIPPV
ncbi:MAG TPA: hypothetical protein VMP01_01205 [Pirellulaceae bacterium]|nr:hypothetical protein [Pirellulaceae bacterium]